MYQNSVILYPVLYYNTYLDKSEIQESNSSMSNKLYTIKYLVVINISNAIALDISQLPQLPQNKYLNQNTFQYDNTC